MLLLALTACVVAEPGVCRQSKGDASDKEAIAQSAEAFIEAFHKGDGKTLAAFWTADGDYTDQKVHKALFIASLALLTLLATSSQAQAWGGYHHGYTHVGPYGAYHVGRTAGYGGYGGYRYGGFGGNYYGGYPYGGYGGFRPGYYRRW